MRLRMKNLNIMGVHWKRIYRGELPEKWGTVCRFKEGLVKKEGGVIPQCTLWKLDDTLEFGKIIKKIIEKEEPTFKNCNKSNLTYNSEYNFYKYYRDTKNLIIFF